MQSTSVLLPVCDASSQLLRWQFRDLRYFMSVHHPLLATGSWLCACEADRTSCYTQTRTNVPFSVFLCLQTFLNHRSKKKKQKPLMRWTSRPTAQLRTPGYVNWLMVAYRSFVVLSLEWSDNVTVSYSTSNEQIRDPRHTHPNQRSRS
jgi:hypothetical protein